MSLLLHENIQVSCCTKGMQFIVNDVFWLAVTYSKMGLMTIWLPLNLQTVNIISLNIWSLPKHGGELLVILEVLEINFHIIVFSEIGARDIGTVEHILPNHDFLITYFLLTIIPGALVSIFIFGVQMMDELSIQKSCHCSKWVIKNLIIKCIYCSKTCILGEYTTTPTVTLSISWQI